VKLDGYMIPAFAGRQGKFMMYDLLKQLKI